MKFSEINKIQIIHSKQYSQNIPDKFKWWNKINVSNSLTMFLYSWL